MKPLERKVIWTKKEMQQQDVEWNIFYHTAKDIRNAINKVWDVPEAVRGQFTHIMWISSDTDEKFVDAEAFAEQMRDLHKWSSDWEKDFIAKITTAVRKVKHVPYVDLDWNPLFQGK